MSNEKISDPGKVKEEVEKMMTSTLVGGGRSELKGISFPANDPWANRAKGMRCATCMWSVVKMGSTATEQGRLGRCRRHAPTMGGFPAVFENDWCGDHKLDELKI